MPASSPAHLAVYCFRCSANLVFTCKLTDVCLQLLSSAIGALQQCTCMSLRPCLVLQAWLKLAKSGAIPTVNAFLVTVLLTIARVKRVGRLQLSICSRSALRLSAVLLWRPQDIAPGRRLRRQCCCTRWRLDLLTVHDLGGQQTYHQQSRDYTACPAGAGAASAAGRCPAPRVCMAGQPAAPALPPVARPSQLCCTHSCSSGARACPAWRDRACAWPAGFWSRRGRCAPLRRQSSQVD